ncbi:MAG: c-type cytochrome [Chloroflexota bacterium]
MRRALLLAALLAFVLLGGCASWEQLQGEGGVPGYVLRPLPEQYRGLHNPYTPADAAAVQAGRALYSAQCLRCHGENGRGAGPQAPNIEPHPANFAAPLLQQAFVAHQDYLFAVVSEGKPQTPMPAFAHALSPDQRWQVLTYCWYLGQR